MQGKVPEMTGTHHTKGPFLGLQLSINDQACMLGNYLRLEKKKEKKKKHLTVLERINT